MIRENFAQIKKAFATAVILFVCMFAARSVYEVYFSQNDIMISYTSEGYIEGESFSKVKNVASNRVSQKDVQGQTVTMDQKYEMVADMSSQSSDFENDNDKLRTAIENNNAVIQMENLSGLSGSQMLNMVIGVSPDSFDKLVAEIKAIGSIKSFHINKTDKTEEFRSLIAEKETLEKTLASFDEIKKKGGSVNDMLLLESKILEVEKSLQTLGVSLGTFSTDVSFCTVNFSLNESAVSEISLRFVLHCMKTSLFWTIGVFVGVSAFIAFLGGVILLIVLEYAKFRKHDQAAAKNSKPDGDAE